MFNSPARTIRRTARLSGRGLHSGAPVDVELRPASPGAGVVFVCGEQRVRTGLAAAAAGPGHSQVGSISTPEHLLAAVHGLGITDLEVHLSTPELPGLDGSAAPWVDVLGEPVITGSITGYTVQRSTRVTGFGGVATATPSDQLELTVTLDFGEGYRCTERWDGALQSIAPARTFVLFADLGPLQDSGRGKGLLPRDVLVLGPRGALVPQRLEREWARHKLLDLLGDLALLGCPVRGAFHIERGSHLLHLELLRALEPAPPLSRSG